MTAPTVEVIQGQHGNARGAPRHSARARVFVATLLPCLVIGLAAVFLRPPVYETAATLLTVKPKGIDQISTEADLEHVAIQQRVLLGDEVLDAVSAALHDDGIAGDVSPGELRGWLTVRAVADTNLVELRAEGADPQLLQSVVNHWADAYVHLRAKWVHEASGRTTAELTEEQGRLQLTLDEKRAALAAFRERHDILSMERQENQVLSRLKGLQDSLNKAQERLVDARAKRTAIESAIAKAQPVVPDYEKANLNAMQAQAQQIRERLAALEKKYTAAYLERDPTLKVLPGQLQALEQSIRQILTVGRQQVLADAEQELATAEAAVIELEAELAAHKQQVADFTSRFAEHQALEQELAALEELANENQHRLARLDIANREKYPPLQVIDRAPLPLDPIRPLYWRDAGLVAGLAVLLALFVAWLWDYLMGRARAEERAVTGIRIYGPEAQALPSDATGREALASDSAARQALPANDPRGLSAPQPRALQVGEVQSLLQAASPTTATHIALLMSGVAPEELTEITIDTDAPQVIGADGRSVALGPVTRRYLAASAPEVQGSESGEQLRAGIAVAAVDAGLAEPVSVTPEALAHTYLVYLVRQGVRLGDLPAAVGPRSSQQLAAYAAYSPPGPKRPLAEIDVIYPALSDS